MIEALMYSSVVINIFLCVYVSQLFKDQKHQWEAMKVLARGVDMCLKFDEQTIESVNEFRNELEKNKQLIGVTMYSGGAQA